MDELRARPETAEPKWKACWGDIVLCRGWPAGARDTMEMMLLTSTCSDATMSRPNRERQMSTQLLLTFFADRGAGAQATPASTPRSPDHRTRGRRQKQPAA